MTIVLMHVLPQIEIQTYFELPTYRSCYRDIFITKVTNCTTIKDDLYIAKYKYVSIKRLLRLLEILKVSITNISIPKNKR